MTKTKAKTWTSDESGDRSGKRRQIDASENENDANYTRERNIRFEETNTKAQESAVSGEIAGSEITLVGPFPRLFVWP